MQSQWNKNIIDFYNALKVQCPLPKGVRALYPMQESATVSTWVKTFYGKYYSDKEPRRLILGINPGRLGAGATGIPFTDTKRLEDCCGIQTETLHTHEPSSVFVYEVIKAYGGPSLFYKDYYISSVCPIGFVRENGAKEVNYNYYDEAEFAAALMPEIAAWLDLQIKWGIGTARVVVFGTGENLKYLKALNARYALFGEIIALEHPRYIMQYKLRDKQRYIDKYLRVLTT